MKKNYNNPSRTKARTRGLLKALEKENERERLKQIPREPPAPSCETDKPKLPEEP